VGLAQCARRSKATETCLTLPAPAVSTVVSVIITRYGIGPGETEVQLKLLVALLHARPGTRRRGERLAGILLSSRCDGLWDCVGGYGIEIRNRMIIGECAFVYKNVCGD
jgi:hypothetical protein